MTAEACLAEHRAEGIGTYKERSQHYILKNYFEPDADLHEIPVCGFVADIKRDREIIEIQTSGFGAMRRKLEAFSNEGYDVTVVYPVAAAQRVVWIDPETGEGKSGIRPAARKTFSSCCRSFCTHTSFLKRALFGSLP